jgi:Lar family restriction alleviation protein
MSNYKISDIEPKPKVENCPFCGGAPIARKDTIGSVAVRCTDCGIGTTWNAAALDQWNAREPSVARTE